MSEGELRITSEKMVSEEDDGKLVASLNFFFLDGR
jgi:hypothetical protein